MNFCGFRILSALTPYWLTRFCGKREWPLRPAPLIDLPWRAWYVCPRLFTVIIDNQMSDDRPTPISFSRAAYLCVLLLFAHNKFIAEEGKDDIARNNYKNDYEQPHSALVVRSAFLKSLMLVGISGVVGYTVGKMTGAFYGCSADGFITWLQIVGACILLWGTLFIRGWEIQTYSGVSLTERVNQWLYRGLYCIGTAVIVYSLTIPGCKQ
jgi:hypothetical protein